jgi:hypothetical protein
MYQTMNAAGATTLRAGLPMMARYPRIKAATTNPVSASLFRRRIRE